MYRSEIYHSREHVIYERRVKTRSGGLYLRDGERINPTLRHDLWYMHIAWSSTLRDDLLQTRGYDIKFVRPLIYDVVINLHCIFKSPIKSYQIKTHTDVPYPCYHGNASSINNYTSTTQSYIYIRSP